jgi:hypothetical protein
MDLAKYLKKGAGSLNKWIHKSQTCTAIIRDCET